MTVWRRESTSQVSWSQQEVYPSLELKSQRAGPSQSAAPTDHPGAKWKEEQIKTGHSDLVLALWVSIIKNGGLFLLRFCCSPVVPLSPQTSLRLWATGSDLGGDLHKPYQPAGHTETAEILSQSWPALNLCGAFRFIQCKTRRCFSFTTAELFTIKQGSNIRIDSWTLGSWLSEVGVWTRTPLSSY